MTDRSEQLKQAADEIGQLLAEKNKAYGDAALTSSEALRLLYPDGIPPEAYTDVLLLTRVWDKMKRIATQKGAFEESPWQDIAGYGLLGVVKDEQQEREGHGSPFKAPPCGSVDVALGDLIDVKVTKRGTPQEPDFRAVVEAMSLGSASPEAVSRNKKEYRQNKGLCLWSISPPIVQTYYVRITAI